MLRARYVKRFGLSKKDLSRAIDKISTSREMSALLGKETPLKYISDENLVFLVSSWWDYRKDNLAGNAIIRRILRKLSPEDIADVQAIYYLASQRQYCESYESGLQYAIAEYSKGENVCQKLAHLFDKSCLGAVLQQGVCMLGSISLSEQLGVINKKREV